MNSKKLPKTNNRDKAWQKKIEKQVVVEKVQLNQPKGRERFDQILLNLLKKPKQ